MRSRATLVFSALIAPVLITMGLVGCERRAKPGKTVTKTTVIVAPKKAKPKPGKTVTKRTVTTETVTVTPGKPAKKP